MAADLGPAVIGVLGTLGGAALTMLGTSLARRRDREAHERDRLWENRRDTYFAVLSWVAAVDKQLGDIKYSFDDYVDAPFLSADDEWPVPIPTKRAEYRTDIHPSQWRQPTKLSEATRVRVLALESSSRLLQTIDAAAESSVRTADEARSLGVNTIRNRERTFEDTDRAREVIGGYFQNWTDQSQRIVDLVRSELDVHDVTAGSHGERLAG